MSSFRCKIFYQDTIAFHFIEGPLDRDWVKNGFKLKRLLKYNGVPNAKTWKQIHAVVPKCVVLLNIPLRKI